MKVIFLDIDGVLNMYGASARTFMKPYGQHIEPHLVQRLNYIIENSRCNIVVSSAWRSDMDDLKTQLEEQGFKYWGNVIGKTCKPKEKSEDIPYPRTRDAYLYNDRGEQICKWLDDSEINVEKYVVVDDETSDILPYVRIENIVQTDSNEGMLDKDAKLIIEKLEEI